MCFLNCVIKSPVRIARRNVKAKKISKIRKSFFNKTMSYIAPRDYYDIWYLTNQNPDIDFKPIENLRIINVKIINYR